MPHRFVITFKKLSAFRSLDGVDVKTVKLSYWTGNNFGDAASPLLVASLLGAPVCHAKLSSANLCAIGSILYGGEKLANPLPGGNLHQWRLLIRHWLRGHVAPTLHVWGSGFLIRPKMQERYVRTRRLRLHAVRGRKTAEVLRQFGYSVDSTVVLGDSGLLYDRLLSGSPTPRYDVGLIPHMADQEAGERLSQALSGKGLKVRWIDVQRPPMEVIAGIAECRTVLSSSLHGCIVADSLHIPNRHLVLSSLGLSWDDFFLKFDDYYSAFGLEGDEPLRPEEVLQESVNLPERLERTSRLPWDAVEERKAMLTMAFPREALLGV